MKNNLSDLLSRNCLFKTDRISVQNWNFVEPIKSSIESVSRIMTAHVTKNLPDGWQNLDTYEKAENWFNERKADSYFYAILLIETNEIIGYLFLYDSEENTELKELRLGYLLAESSWGKGIGSELIKGLVKCCRETETINSISGGVDKDNLGSVKVLEKNGFYKSNDALPGDMILYKLDFNIQNDKY